MNGDAPIAVRPATAGELPTVCNVLDGGLLAVDADAVSAGIDAGEVLVAVGERADAASILGALVLDGDEITAIAVRRRRRDQGIGTALVEAARIRREHLFAEFDERVRPFWEALGFTIEEHGAEDRFRGTLQG